MKHYKIVLPAAAAFALMGTTAAFAQDTETRSFSASVSGALQGDTGFLTGGSVQVQGVGQGAVNMTRAQANVGVISGAFAGLDGAEIPQSSSRMISTFEFDRTVDTSAALVGVGNVVAQGESLGGVGVVGTSSANASRAGTGTDAGGDPTSGSASSPTTATGSLVGQFQTQSTMQLQGQGSLFAGAQTLDIGERNAGIAAGQTGLVSAGATAVDLDDLDPDFTAGALGVTGDGGALFASTSSLEGNEIDINVANAGQGSILVSGSSGGFFGQGTTFGASANPTFAETNGFFD